ncbi:MAG TPA: hypothetical protein VNV86_22590 [Candidatus Acidoferrum sp.]|nr:hypothetical protein [Candidatus Acidoferrum sp.]
MLGEAKSRKLIDTAFALERVKDIWDLRLLIQKAEEGRRDETPSYLCACRAGRDVDWRLVLLRAQAQNDISIH